MNKKEIAEIKKTLKPEYTSIDFIVTAPISHTESGTRIGKIQKQRLLVMDETDMMQYLDIVKATLGGKLEKNLLGVGFPADECIGDGCQDKLYKLVQSGLANDTMIEDFIKNIAANCGIIENMMIQLVHCAYDVPVKTKDGRKTDASDSVYDFIICSICPLVPEKPGICYDEESGVFEPLKQRMIADKPVLGFLYPAFNDRAADANELLFYTKKEDEIHPELILALTGSKAPIPASAQKQLFTDILKKLDKQADFDDAKSIHGEVRARIDNSHMNEEDTHITKRDVKAIIENTVGSVDDKDFDTAYESVMEHFDEGSLVLENIVDVNRFDIEVPDIQIKVKPDKISEIEQKIVDGRKCFAIPVSDSIKINGDIIE